MAKSKRLCAILLRLLALGAALTATIVMATSRETVVVYTIPVKVKYSDTLAFKFFLVVNIIATIYSFLVLFLPSTSMLWSLVVALDMVVTMLLTAGISAAGAIAYIGKKGDSHAGWLPICGQVSKYCDHVGGALISGVTATVIYMVLILYAIHGVLNPLLLQA